MSKFNFKPFMAMDSRAPVTIRKELANAERELDRLEKIAKSPNDPKLRRLLDDVDELEQELKDSEKLWKEHPEWPGR